MQKISEEITECFCGCNISDQQTFGRLIAVNEKFLAMSWKSKGKIVIVDSSKSSQSKHIFEESPYLKIKDSKILDLEFSPFNYNILASAHSDNSVLLWNIPKEGLTKIINNQNTIYNKHKNKVNFINFNPIAADVICSSTINGNIHIWSVEKRDNFIEFKTDWPAIVSWNQNGNLIGVNTKNNNIDIFDPRNRKISLQKKLNSNSRQSKFVWNDDNLFSTISWPKGSQNKMMHLWDIKKLDKEVDSIFIYSSIDTFNPFIDRELKLLYIVGQKKIDIYDYNKNSYKEFFTFNYNETSHHSVLFNRKCLNKEKSEIGRFLRYSNNNKKIYYLSYMLNNKEEFGDNLYPEPQFGNDLITNL